MGDVTGASNGASFDSVCTCHTRVIPSESYAALPTGAERLREVALLQQKARSLEAEIAHRAEVENALSKRERELADFFENATEGLHRVGPDGTILWANKAELDLLGYSAGEYIGRHIAEFHADRDVIDDMLARLLRGETLINQPARMRHKDGSIRHVLLNSNACFEDGKFVYTRCFTRDVTERKLAEEERARRAAAELEASKAEARRRAFFLNAVSHDLRTPLNGLVLQASLARLSVETGDAATLAETLTHIESSVAATSDLLNALLEVARSGDAGDVGTPEVFALDEQVERLAGACRASASEKGLSLRVTAPPGLRVRTERVKLERILLNLLDNAIKFTETGSVHVEVQQSGRDVRVHVVDTGVGIAPGHQRRLFEEFYQVGNRERDRRKGFGLGLAVAHRLAAQLGGGLAVESEPGRGSRFTVSLPGVAGDE
jgi:PAS domain S-box-containing protein